MLDPASEGGRGVNICRQIKVAGFMMCTIQCTTASKQGYLML